jgi:opine dehydrogenase
MKLAILGTGHVGHAVAAHVLRRDVDMAMMARTADRAEALAGMAQLSFTAPDTSGSFPMPTVSVDAATVIDGADIVFLAVPAHGHHEWLQKMAGLLSVGQMLVVIGAFGGLRYQREFPVFAQRGVVIVEISTSPFPCRSFSPGSVIFYGGRPSLPAAIYGQNREKAMERLSLLFDGLSFPANPLAVSLIAANPIVHAPLSLLNAGHIESADGAWNLFRDGATPSVVEVMLAADGERRAISAALGVPLPSFAAARVAGDIAHGEIAAQVSAYYANSAMHNDPRQPAPRTLAMRYVLEDVPYYFGGWSALSRRLGISTPTLDAFVSIYRAMQKRLGGPDTVGLEEMGLGALDAAGLRNLTPSDAIALG